jgi:hypothetical protein
MGLRTIVHQNQILDKYEVHRRQKGRATVARQFRTRLTPVEQFSLYGIPLTAINETAVPGGSSQTGDPRPKRRFMRFPYILSQFRRRQMGGRMRAGADVARFR